jgi:hypothetical protein
LLLDRCDRAGTPPPAVTRSEGVFALDVLTTDVKEFTNFVAFVRQKRPALEPRRPALPVRVPATVAGHEAIVATPVTSTDLHVWGITSSTVMTAEGWEDDVSAKVKRLRSGSSPQQQTEWQKLPPFDGSRASSINRLAPIEPALRGVTDVPKVRARRGAPAVLVTARPPKPQITTAADFSATKFLVDRYAFAALADLSLFPWHRDQALRRDVHARFLGVGAPLLSAEEVAAGPRARSNALAGGLDGKDSGPPAEARGIDRRAQELAAIAKG